MIIYQLRILDLGEYLEPIFKTKERALYYKEKYKSRNIIIKEKYLENIKNDIVYRIKTEDMDGYFLEDEIFTSKCDASHAIKNDYQSVIESRLYWWVKYIITMNF